MYCRLCAWPGCTTQQGFMKHMITYHSNGKSPHYKLWLSSDYHCTCLSIHNVLEILSEMYTSLLQLCAWAWYKTPTKSRKKVEDGEEEVEDLVLPDQVLFSTHRWKQNNMSCFNSPCNSPSDCYYILIIILLLYCWTWGGGRGRNRKQRKKKRWRTRFFRA